MENNSSSVESKTCVDEEVVAKGRHDRQSTVDNTYVNQSMNEDMEAIDANVRLDSRGRDRQSMSRFGTDLTEVVVSYLTLEDKVVLQWLCEEWSHVVFNKQRAIALFDYWIPSNANRTTSVTKGFLRKNMKQTNGSQAMDSYIEALEALLKRCPNVTEIGIEYRPKAEELF